MIRVLTVLFLLAPTSAFACAFGFAAKTYPIEYTVWGLVAASFLGILFGESLKERKAFWRSIVLSCMIGTFGLGLFAATASDHFGFGGFAVWSILLMPFLLFDYKTRLSRALTLGTICLWSLCLSAMLHSAQEQAERVGEFQKFDVAQPYDVTF